MRIAHVVSLVAEGGAFGGPVSVAYAQTEELARRGHAVRLLAGWDGKGHCDPPGVDVSLHRVRRAVPAHGFSGLVAPGLWRQLRQIAPELDVLHVHLARDFVTLLAARLGLVEVPCVVIQTHGMVMPDNRISARLADAIATRRVLREAHSAAALTETERDGLRLVARDLLHVDLLPNGVDVRPVRGLSEREYPRTVLFCARLHPRKRVLAFAEMARKLIADGVAAQFVVAGRDEGDLSKLQRIAASPEFCGRICYIGSLPPERVRALLASVAVFVLPSEREPFPMTLLEAMAEGTPSVITDGCMISAELGSSGGAVVTDGSPDQLAQAVRRILDDPQAGQQLGARAREIVQTNYAVSKVVDQLEAIYTRGHPPVERHLRW